MVRWGNNHLLERVQHQPLVACRRTLEEMFDDFAEKPVASGSIAQIHKAHLSEGGAHNSDYPQGTTVAVKVLLTAMHSPAHCPSPMNPHSFMHS